MNFPVVIFWFAFGLVSFLILAIIWLLGFLAWRSWGEKFKFVAALVGNSAGYWAKFYILGTLFTILLVGAIAASVRFSTFVERLRLSGTYHGNLSNCALQLDFGGSSVWYPLPGVAQVGNYRIVPDGIQVELSGGNYLLFRLLPGGDLEGPAGLVLRQKPGR